MHKIAQAPIEHQQTCRWQPLTRSVIQITMDAAATISSGSSRLHTPCQSPLSSEHQDCHRKPEPGGPPEHLPHHPLLRGGALLRTESSRKGSLQERSHQDTAVGEMHYLYYLNLKTVQGIRSHMPVLLLEHAWAFPNILLCCTGLRLDPCANRN